MSHKDKYYMKKLPYHQEKYHVKRQCNGYVIEWDFSKYWKCRLKYLWEKYSSWLWLICHFGFRWKKAVREMMGEEVER